MSPEQPDNKAPAKARRRKAKRQLPQDEPIQMTFDFAALEARETQPAASAEVPPRGTPSSEETRMSPARNPCPDCGAGLRPESGCMYCPSCGYSGCGHVPMQD
jgi:hypothetical protein